METGSKKRQPLSDRTNTSASANYSLVSSSSSSFVKPTKPEPSVPVSSVFEKLLNDIKNDTSVKRNDSNNRTSASSNPSDPKSSPPPPPHTPAPSQPLKSTSASGNGKHEDSEPYTVYTRRKSARTIRRRGKEIAKPTSFSPAAKSEYKRDKMNKVGNTCASKSYTVPHRKVGLKLFWYQILWSSDIMIPIHPGLKPRGILSKQDNSNCALPKDFIEQQRDYFAEIDAFELLEEEVKSDDDLT